MLELPPDRLADSLLTAAATVEGVRVESIRPYAGVIDPHRELELLEALAADPADSAAVLADGVARIFRAGWALVLDAPAGPTVPTRQSVQSAAERGRARARRPADPAAAGGRRRRPARSTPTSRGRPRTGPRVGTELAVAPLGRRRAARRPAGPALAAGRADAPQPPGRHRRERAGDHAIGLSWIAALGLSAWPRSSRQSTRARPAPGSWSSTTPAREVGRHQLEHEQILPRPGWVEHDPVEIWQPHRRGDRRRRCVSSACARPTSPRSAITNQRETTVVWNRRTGRPYANAIVWQDTRTDDIVAELEARRPRRPDPRADRAAAGDLLLRPASSPGSCATSTACGPTPSAATRCSAPIDSWLLWNLTGGVAAASRHRRHQRRAARC